MAKTTAGWCKAITDSAVQGALRKRLRDRHVRGRKLRDPATGRSLALAPPLQSDPSLNVSDGDILVRSEDADRAAPLLKKRGFGAPQPASCTGDSAPTLQVSIFEKPGAAAKELSDAVDELLTQRINASLNHILPDGGAKNGVTGAAFEKSRRAMTTQPDPNAGSGIVVAVIDTGIAEHIDERDDPSNDPANPPDSVLAGIGVHPDNIDPLREINQGETPKTDFLDMGAGHGTFVSGVIRQIAPKADVRVYRALDSDGIGSELSVACAILRAANEGADIINLSLGQESYRDRPPVALQAALGLVPTEVIVVASAGNLDDTHADELTAMRPHWPAAFRRVVAVGAVTDDYSPAVWSKRGHWVDVSTWGQDVVSTFVQGDEAKDATTNLHPDSWPATDKTPWARWSGTSFSAPQIAGILAASAAAGGIAPREALATLMGEGWYEDKFGVVIPTPFLS